MYKFFKKYKILLLCIILNIIYEINNIIRLKGFIKLI